MCLPNGSLALGTLDTCSTYKQVVNISSSDYDTDTGIEDDDKKVCAEIKVYHESNLIPVHSPIAWYPSVCAKQRNC